VGASAEALRAAWSFRRDKRWADAESQRDRYEAVYEALERVREAYGDASGAVLFTIRRGEKRSPVRAAARAPNARLRMLVRLYCPQFAPSLKRVESARETLGNIWLISLASKDETAAQVDKSSQNIGQALKQFFDAVDAMVDVIAEGSQTLERQLAGLMGSRVGSKSPLRARWIAGVLFGVALISVPVIVNVLDDQRLRRTEARGNAVIAAIDHYTEQIGRLPDSLAALRPYYLRSIPTPTWGDGSWRYQQFASVVHTSHAPPIFELRVCMNASCYPVLYFNSALRRWVLDQ